MVQVYANPAGGVFNADATDARTPPVANTNQDCQTPSSREDQKMKELHLKRDIAKGARRHWSSLKEYQDYLMAQEAQSQPQPVQTASGQVNLQTSIPENSVLPAVARPAAVMASQLELEARQAALATAFRAMPPPPPVRRVKPPPRRSQSVTDKEPESNSENHSDTLSGLSIVDLPPELHYLLLDFLDPLDAVCLALTHSRIYDVLRRKHPKVSLSSRYSGPNDLEWAWRGARHVVAAYANRGETAADDKSPSNLERLRVKGQVYCRKCGISRCELHRHLKSWMGDGYEYCEIKECFGKPAGEEAKPYCFMASPKDRRRCGRHGPRKSAQ